MKLIYLCECCDREVAVLRLPSGSGGVIGTAPPLTPPGPGDIIKTGSRYYVRCLCDDCREMLYGPPEIRHCPEVWH